MGEVDEFLSSMLPTIHEMDVAFHNGDVGPRERIWSHNDPVTLFGAVFTRSGWNEVAPAFDFLTSRFSDCESFEYEVIAAGASCDLAYIVGIERTKASVGGAPATYALRVTTIFRREGGAWKIVHRHADSVPDDGAPRGWGNPLPTPRRSSRTRGSGYEEEKA